MEIKAANVQGNSPNFRPTVDDTLVVRGQLNVANQQWIPFPAGPANRRPNKSVDGALYFNTTSNIMKVYTGSAWVAAYVSGSINLDDITDKKEVPSTREEIIRKSIHQMSSGFIS